MLIIQPFERVFTHSPGIYSAWVEWDGTTFQRSMGKWSLSHHFLRARIPSSVMHAYVLAFIEEMELKKHQKFPVDHEDLVSILLRYV